MSEEKEQTHIVAEIKIDATAEQVWAVLMDFDQLPQWSNSFLGTDKPMKLGEVSTAYFKNPLGGKPLSFTHEVVVFEAGRRFGWSGDMGNGLHDHHVYEIEDAPEGGVIFRQRDGLYGKPSSIMARLVEHGMAASYESFNKRLKARVEQS